MGLDGGKVAKVGSAGGETVVERDPDWQGR
jgi:hypothetical protein